MRLCKAAIVAAGISIVLSTAADSHHPAAVVAAPIAKALGTPLAGGGGGAAIAGAFVPAVAVAVVWCANNQPKRNMRKDIWVDGRHDAIPMHNPRRDGCLFKGKKDPKPAKLWPGGK